MRRSLLGGGVAVALAVLTGSGCTGSGQNGIEVATVGRATITEVVEAPASVQARASTTLASTADGTLAVLYVRDGQRVSAGSLIARISSPDTLSRLRAAQAQLSRADASVPGPPAYLNVGGAQLQADTAAQQAFAAAGRAAAQVPDPRLRATALSQLAAAQRQYALAQAQAQAAIEAINAGVGNLSAVLTSLTQAQQSQAQVAVTAAQRAVDALTIRAPIAGVVQLGGTVGGASGAGTSSLGSALDQLPADVRDQLSSVLGGASTGASAAPVQTTGPVTAGMPVSTGMPLAAIVDTAVLSLMAEVDETDVFLVRPGVPASVELDAVPGARYRATVSAIDLTPTQSARGGVSYRVRLSLGRGRRADGDPAPTPRPGMSAVADLQVRVARQAIAVPASAVVRSGDRDAVWVVVAGTARQRTVTVGTQGEDLVQVTDGLREGDRVVVRGADKVSAGQDLS